MKFNLRWIIKNLHLLISIIIVVPTAIIYGSPLLLPDHLEITVNSIDLANMLKAIICLYIAIANVWILGLFKNSFWKPATQLNVLFMFSLGTGRALSMISDGLPSDGYIFGIIAELFLGIYSVYQLKKYNNKEEYKGSSE